MNAGQPHNFADWLRAAMQAHGLSQSDLAKRGHLSVSTVNKLLSGVRPNLSARVVRGLAQGLGTTPMEICRRYFEEDFSPPPTPETQILQKLSQLETRVTSELSGEAQTLIRELIVAVYAKAQLSGLARLARDIDKVMMLAGVSCEESMVEAAGVRSAHLQESGVGTAGRPNQTLPGGRVITAAGLQLFE